MEIGLLKTDLVRDEGMKLHPYVDTVGKTTIGVGRNLDDVGLTEQEVLILLQNDITNTLDELAYRVPWIFEKPEPVQRAVANMLFNMGWPRLSQFKRMLAALEKDDFMTAANEALESRWASQVGDRARRIAKLIREA